MIEITNRQLVSIILILIGIIFLVIIWYRRKLKYLSELANCKESFVDGHQLFALMEMYYLASHYSYSDRLKNLSDMFNLFYNLVEYDYENKEYEKLASFLMKEVKYLKNGNNVENKVKEKQE